MPPPSAVSDRPDGWWRSVLETAESQLREQLREATDRARTEIEASAIDLARRESELGSRQATIAARERTLNRLAEELAERERVTEDRLRQAERATNDAMSALSDAMSRSAELIAETERRIAERETDTERHISRMIEHANAHAARIVGAAQTTVDRSRAELRDLAGSIQAVLHDDEDADLAPVDLRESARQPKIESAPEKPGGMLAETDDPTTADDSGWISDAVQRAVNGWTGRHHTA